MSGAARPRILIVEDDPALTEMLQAYLSAQGYRILTSNLGSHAVDAATTHVPDLIILDINLPDFDGFEVCQRIRNHRHTRNTPVIFLTELSQHLHRLHGLELGSLDYITKPFDIQELRLRIRNTLARSTAFATENPVTGLPGGDEVWASLDQARQAGHAALVVCLGGLDTFRDLYGFVASDEVLRVTGMMLSNATREIGGESAFCGHLDQNTLILIVPANRLDKLEYRIRERSVHSLEYFYPSDNRGSTAHTSDRLRLDLGRILDLNVPADDLRLLRTYALGTHGSVHHSG